MSKKKKRILRLAIFGALVAWLAGRRKSKTPPEGAWKEAFPEEDPAGN